MRKSLLSIVSIVALAFLAKADFAGSGDSLENLSVGYIIQNNTDDSGLEQSSAKYWYASNIQEATECVVSNYTEALTIARPDHWSTGSNTNFLMIDAESVLYRTLLPHSYGNTDVKEMSAANFGAVTNEANIYFDSLVQFTMTETAPEVLKGDKLVVWLYGSDDPDAPYGACTNLMVTASYVNESSDSVQTNYMITTVAGTNCVGTLIEPSSWHRLTVRMMKTVSAEKTLPGFIIYIDQQPVGFSSDIAACDPASAMASLTPSASVYYSETVHQIFPSLQIGGQDDDTRVSAVGFEGTGAVDDIWFSKTAPTFVADPTLFELKWNTNEGVTAIAYTVGDGASKSVTSLTSGRELINLGVLSADATVKVAVTYDEANGWGPGTWTVSGTGCTLNNNTNFVIASTAIDPSGTIVAQQALYDVGGNKFATFKEALTYAATHAGSVVKVEHDVTIGDEFDSEGFAGSLYFDGDTFAGDEFILDLAGHVLIGTGANAAIVNGGCGLIVTNSTEVLGAVVGANGSLSAEAGITTIYGGAFSNVVTVTTIPEDGELHLCGGRYFDNDDEGEFTLEDCVDKSAYTPSYVDAEAYWTVTPRLVFDIDLTVNMGAGMGSTTITVSTNSAAITPVDGKYRMESDAEATIAITNAAYADGYTTPVFVSASEGVKSVNGLVITTGTTNEQSVTLSATPIAYTISYKYQGGDFTMFEDGYTAPLTFYVTNAAIALPVDANVKDIMGAQFQGWTNALGEAVTEIAAGTHSNVTVYANWLDLTYNITYVLGDGGLSGDPLTPATYTVRDTVVLPTTGFTNSIEGQVFDGWMTNSVALTGWAAHTITGDVTVTARWINDIVFPRAGDTGNGTAENPFGLSTYLDLLALKNAIAADAGFAGSNFVLKADIDLAGKNWAGIDGFTGTFNGAGYALQNVTLAKGTNKGVFNSVTGATIKNLTVEFDALTGSGDDYSVALVGSANGVTFDKVCVFGDAANSAGFVANATGADVNFTNCTNDMANASVAFVKASTATVVNNGGNVSVSTVKPLGASAAGFVYALVDDGMAEFVSTLAVSNQYKVYFDVTEGSPITLTAEKQWVEFNTNGVTFTATIGNTSGLEMKIDDMGGDVVRYSIAPAAFMTTITLDAHITNALYVISTDLATTNAVNSGVAFAVQPGANVQLVGAFLVDGYEPDLDTTTNSVSGATITVGPMVLTPVGDASMTLATKAIVYTIEYHGTNSVSVLPATAWKSDPTTNFTVESAEITLPTTNDCLNLLDGYVFVGWYDNLEYTGDKITSFTPATNPGNKKFYLQLEQIWPMVNGEIVSFEELETNTTSQSSIVFPSAPTVEGNTVTFGSNSATFPSYYTVTLNGTTVVLDLNTNAIPELVKSTADTPAISFFVDDEVEYIQIKVSGTYPRLWYGLSFATTPVAESWTAPEFYETGDSVNDIVLKATTGSGNGKFYRVYVTDIEPEEEVVPGKWGTP